VLAQLLAPSVEPFVDKPHLQELLYSAIQEMFDCVKVAANTFERTTTHRYCRQIGAGINAPHGLSK